MAIKTDGRYQASDGTLFVNEREAQRYQDALNNSERKAFRLKTWENFVTLQQDGDDKEYKKIYNNLPRGNYGIQQSEEIFKRLWVGTTTDTIENQREAYQELLNTILGENEVHLKADGSYRLVETSGGKAFTMTKKTDSAGNVLDLNVNTGMVDFRLSTDPTKKGAPKTFTLTDITGGKTIGFGLQFVNNVYTAGSITITWTA